MDVPIVATVSYKRSTNPIILLEDIYHISDELISADFVSREIVCSIETECREELEDIRGVVRVNFAVGVDF